MHKIRIYHFHNGTGGGVLSVIKNLLKFSVDNNIENHIIHTINKAIVPDFNIDLIEGAASQQVYYYSAQNNFYYTCRQLAKLLPDDKAVIVAHDWLELGMASHLGLQNPVVFFLHGDYNYYYKLAEKHEKAINLFIPVAQNIAVNLKKLLSQRINDINYLRFPVPPVRYIKNESNDMDIVFIGRLEESKGYSLLPIIARTIKEKNIETHWHIIGTKSIHDNDVKWDKNILVKLYGEITNAELLKILPNMKLIILPSLAEGMPVVLIESMKAGVIPIVNNIAGGIQELVIDNETGYKIKNNEISRYVEIITNLIGDKKMLVHLRNNCVELANSLFNPFENTIAIENKIISMFIDAKMKKPYNRVYGSRLDMAWLPNWIVKALRKLM